jgi:lipopolysaccharide export LptBFGC system permease protein LptF
MINLYNGNFQKFNNEEPQDIEILFFKEYKFDLSSLFKNKEISLSKRYNNIPTMELFNMFANPKTNNVLGRNEVISELNYRLFFPLISIILSLLSGSLILNFTFNRASNIKSISITSLILVLVYAIFLFLFQKSSNNIYLIYVLFAFMILITSVSIHLIKD